MAPQLATEGMFINKTGASTKGENHKGPGNEKTVCHVTLHYALPCLDEEATDLLALIKNVKIN